MPKELKDKPAGVDAPAPEDLTQPHNPGEKKVFNAFSPIDAVKDGIETGAITTEKFEFKEVGSRLVGYLVGRRQINIPDKPWLYEVENKDGDWSFWGTTLIDGRMEEVPDGVILDITYEGERHGTVGGRNYKNFKIKYYQVPKGFDPCQWRVSLTPDGKQIVFHDAPTQHPNDNEPF